MRVNKELNNGNNSETLFRVSLHPDLASYSNQVVQIPGFNKMQNTKAGNLRTDSSNRN